VTTADQQYQRRILFVIAAAVLLTGLLLLWPRSGGPRVLAVLPAGTDVSVNSTLQLQFAEDVDRPSIEQALSLDPPLELQLSWQDRLLIATPLQPLQPLTEYRLVLAAGAAARDGAPSRGAREWRFTTRGSRLLAVRQSGAATELWLIDPQSAEPRQLAVFDGTVDDLTVDPHGNRALLVVARAPQRSALELLDLADGSRRPLLDQPDASFAAPAWSSVEDLIAFERRSLIDGVLGLPAVWLTQLDESAAAPLLPADARAPAFAPVWSPDGSRLALLDVLSQQVLLYSFFSDRVSALPLYSGERVSWLADGSALIVGSAAAEAAGMRLQLEQYDLADGRVTALTDPAAAALAPAAAPAGRRIAYIQRELDGRSAALWLLDDAAVPRRIGSSGDWQDTLPAWSPDGSRLAVLRIAPNAVGSVVVIDPQTGNEQTVFSDAVQFVWVP
jgi:Tol biopolymer transport system component